MNKTISLLLCMIMCIGLTSCSKMNETPDEVKILADFNAKFEDMAYANFDRVEILRQQLNKENKTFVADIALKGRDEYADYKATIYLHYNYYDDKGWMLGSYSEPDITCQCFRGMTDEDVSLYDLDDFVDWPTAIYQYGEFDKENNRHCFYFNTSNKGQSYAVVEYKEAVIFEYINGEWRYTENDRTLLNEFFDIEGTTWEAIPRKGWTRWHNVGPEINIISVTGTQKISFKYGEELFDAEFHGTTVGGHYAYKVNNAASNGRHFVEVITIEGIGTEEPKLRVFESFSYDGLNQDYLEYDIKKLSRN